ncbi:MAG: PAS domain-containing protein [Candidatus Omnitrophica bacterium]|nr:PAS domain-containing protein [Candidatus Omnitrophota bacterium]
MEDRNKNKDELLLELDSLRKRVLELEITKAKEDEYKQIVENANSIILLMNTKGVITFFNQYAQRFFGFHEQEILGKSVLGTIVPDKDSSGKDLISMINDIVKNPERHFVNENENMRRNGEPVRILWSNKALIGKYGKIEEILCIGNKIAKPE